MADETNEDSSKTLTRLKKYVSAWDSYYKPNNENYREDVRFVYEKNGQWDDDEVSEYDIENRPMFTYNITQRIITGIVAEYASNTPETKVRADDFTEVSQEKVDLMAGLMRNISFKSRSNLVYQNAFLNSVQGGFGAMQTNIQKERVGSFNSVLAHEGIIDPTMCFWDVAAEDKDKGDGMICGRYRKLSKSTFKSKYPDAEIPTHAPDWTYQGFEWFSEFSVIVADCYEKIPVQRSFSLLSDNTSVLTENAKKDIAKKNKVIKEWNIRFPDRLTPKVKILKEEVQDDFDIKFYRITGNEILEDPEWEGNKLPIIFQGGIVRWLDGKERTYSMTRWLKDPQRAYNYYQSEAAYRTKLTRYEPYLVTPTMTKGHSNAWKNAHLAKAGLFYNPDPIAGKPERQVPQEVPQSIFIGMKDSMDAMQQISGRFDSNIGAQSNEISGRAIERRQIGGNLNVKELFTNGIDAIESLARVDVNLVPKVYDTQRIINVTKEDGTTIPAKINDNEENKIPDTFFEVTVTVGASFEIQQEKAKQTIAQAYQVIPALAQIAPDIYAENLDIKNASTLVKRAKEQLIPEIAAQEGDEGAKKALAQKEQKGNQTEQLQQELVTLQIKEKQLVNANLQLDIAKKTQDLKLDGAKKQQDMVIADHKSQDDTVQAQSSMMSGTATLMNAETTKSTAVMKGIIESKKIQAEDNKSDATIQIAALRLAKEVDKDRKDSEAKVDPEEINKLIESGGEFSQ